MFLAALTSSMQALKQKSRLQLLIKVYHYSINGNLVVVKRGLTVFYQWKLKTRRVSFLELPVRRSPACVSILWAVFVLVGGIIFRGVMLMS